MEQAGLLNYFDNDGPVITAEFGCGRAELSRYVSKAQLFTHSESFSSSRNNHKSRPFLLIDRGGPRMKFDTKMMKDYEEDVLGKQNENNYKDDEIPSKSKESEIPVPDETIDEYPLPPPDVKRAIIDIKDLNLNVALNELFPDNKESSIVAISKHLCGCATDLTLQCLANNTVMPNNDHVLNQDEHGEKPSHKLKGLVIALCCRHICTYEMYPQEGRKFLMDQGLITTPESFTTLAKMASWATNGRRENLSPTNESTNVHPSGMSLEQREKLGILARRAIDHGRLLFLRRLGYNVKLVQYVDSSTSLENVALIAQWPR